MRTIRIGLLGLGTVGAAVAEALLRHAELLTQRTGRRPVLHRVAVADIRRPRRTVVPFSQLTADACALVRDPEVDVVIEAIGGVEPAAWYVAEALRAAKHVITANKLLVSTHGRTLSALAASAGVAFRYEAAVGAALPLVQILGAAFAGDRVRSLVGVLNGTVNDILTRVEAGTTFPAALDAARAAGLAEPNPHDDVSGRDSAAKLAILATLVFDAPVAPSDVPCRGIEGLREEEVCAARDHRTPIRLVAAARRRADVLELGVFPMPLPSGHPLAELRGPSNGLLLHCDLAGEVFLRGRGAGGAATASAILGDLVAIARDGRAWAAVPTSIPIVSFPRPPLNVGAPLPAGGWA